MGHSNFHTHSRFCDGHGEPEEYVKEAIEKGFTALGFTSHAPIPGGSEWHMKKESLDEYIAEITRLKNVYEKDIEIYLGLEQDYLQGNLNNQSIIPKSHIDYRVGSVHMLFDSNRNKYYSVDGPESEFIQMIDELCEGNAQKCVEMYYHEVMRIIKEEKFEILGHFDIIKKNNNNNKFFSPDGKWYKDLVETVLKEISKTKIIVEVNTGGKIRGYTDDFYPSNWILEKCKALDIPIILNSDAHSPENIDKYFDEAEDILRCIGYTHQTILLHGQWQPVALY